MAPDDARPDATVAAIEGVSDPVDAHVHVMPERLLEAIHGNLHDVSGWTFDHPTTPAGIEATLRDHGVARYFCLPYAHRPDMAADLNEWVCEFAADSEMAIPFATVHGEDDVEAVVRSAFDAGARGLKFQCPVQECGPDDPRLDPAFELAAEYDRSIIFHAGTAPLFADSPHVGADAFASFVDSYPEVRVCAAHLGSSETDRFFEFARVHDQVYLDTTMALSPQATEYGFPDPATVDTADLEACSDSIMFGTDLPLLPTDYAMEIVGITDRDLSTAALGAIFGNTARSFVAE